ncbi:hypothetical protein C8R43DRAFT_1151491 [Mycena crocata]|nr:hypothetical protein C8R43DRAFT_1151491 [Mycena crocata]
MTILCLGALHPPRLLRTRQRRQTTPELPNELWSEIFSMLDRPDLPAISRVNRVFNALAVPMYLATFGVSPAELADGALRIPGYRPDVLAVVQTAFFLPPIRKLDCGISGDNKSSRIRFLKKVEAQKSLQHLRLHCASDLLSPLEDSPEDPNQKPASRITLQKDTLIVTADGSFISGFEDGNLWQLVHQRSSTRGIRAKLRKAATSIKSRTRSPAWTNLVLRASGEVKGTFQRKWCCLEHLYSLDVTYASPRDDWALLVLNARHIRRLNLTSPLTTSQWVHCLPLLELELLFEVEMGSTTTRESHELRDMPMADLDAFLTRHMHITRLQYIPELPLILPDVSPFTQAVSLTHLTTTPAHFIHLHRAPNTFPQLEVLNLFGTPSTPLSQSKQQMMTVMGFLEQSAAQGVCTRFPGAWISTPSPDLRISTIESMLLFGDFELDLAAMSEYLAPFEPGLKRVEFHPKHAPIYERKQFVDALRSTLPAWLENIYCTRGDPDWVTETIDLSANRETFRIEYDDE